MTNTSPSMRTNLVGRVENTPLAPAKVTFPLFEAIVNAFQSVLVRGRADRHITIKIFRDLSHGVLNIKDPASEPIVSLSVVDNGEGFSNTNFESFLTSDSSHKKHLGGKGIGRVLWLKAFEFVDISSNYVEGGKWNSRRFKFENTAQGISNYSMEESTKAENLTEVKLTAAKAEYQSHLPRTLKSLAVKIIEHCLQYFVNDVCTVVLEEADGRGKLDLNQEYKSEYKIRAIEDVFDIGPHKFKVLHLKLNAPDQPHHRIHYCADLREVFNMNLERHIANLAGKLRETDGTTFFISSFVSGTYLDQKVSPLRADFQLSSDDTLSTPDQPSLMKINESALQSIKDTFKDYLTRLDEDKEQQIKDYVGNDGAQYRWILKDPIALSQVPPNLPKEKLELALHKATKDKVVSIKKSGQDLLDRVGKDLDPDKLAKVSAEFSAWMKAFNDVGNSKLADYVAYRKLVLRLLQKSLERRSDTSSYALEETIHKSIFPLQNTSDDIMYDDQNLWIIDERLSYHYYLASDKQLKTMAPVVSTSAGRPDIIIFNRPFAFASGTPNQHFNTITIIEFKKPMRPGYTDSDDPVRQVLDYIDDIKEGTVKSNKGRPLPVGNIPFYCYIICDITDKIKRFAKQASLAPGPDGEGAGWFGQNPQYNAYIEIISFDKLLADANKRNQILFDKLGLPTT